MDGAVTGPASFRDVRWKTVRPVMGGRIPPVHEKGSQMHGGLPFIGFSTIVYGGVGLAVLAGNAVAKFRRHR